MILIGSFPTNLRNYVKGLNQRIIVNLSKNIVKNIIFARKKKPPCNTTEQGQEPIIEYEYRCYKCVKDNHETDE